MRLRSEDSIKCIENSLKFKLYKGLYIYINYFNNLFKKLRYAERFFLGKIGKQKVADQKNCKI